MTQTIRDEFAAQAFGPILAFKIAQFGHPCPSVYEDAAQAAYEAADAAMKRRSQPDPKRQLDVDRSGPHMGWQGS